MEDKRQQVQQEATHEFHGAERHGLVFGSALGAIVLPLEGDAARIQGDESAVGDRDPVGVAGQVLEDHGGATKGSFGINDPLGAPGLGDQTREPRPPGQRLERSVEAKPTVVEGFGEQGQELASEQTAQEADRRSQGLARHQECYAGRRR